MMKKISLMFGMALLTLASFAQQATATDVKGTPYLDDKYVEGVIYFGDKSQKAPVRYNAYKDLLEYTQNGKALVLDPVLTITKVECGNTTFVTRKYKDDGKSKVGYFTVLDSGKVSLYAKKNITFMQARKGGALDGSDAPAEYKRNPDVFYIKVGDGELLEVGNLKSTIASFPDKQDELSQYAKKEKISPKKEKEIVALVQYYNSL